VQRALMLAHMDGAAAKAVVVYGNADGDAAISVKSWLGQRLRAS